MMQAQPDDPRRQSPPRSSGNGPPARRSRGRRRNQKSRRNIAMTFVQMGPIFFVMVAFCFLFLLLNVILHARLGDQGFVPSDQTGRTANQIDSHREPNEEYKNVEKKSHRRFSAKIMQALAGASRAKQQDPPEKVAQKNTRKEAAHTAKTEVDSPMLTKGKPRGQNLQIDRKKLYNFRGALDDGKPTEQHSSPEVTDMRQLTATLRFDNPDGGAWKQGWDVEPRKVSEEDPLTVFVVPHSHNDPGWIKTFDQYFKEQTTHIITTIVEALEADPDRTFIWAEISYFSWWWKEQDVDMQNRALKVLDNGQLEFVTGGWVMPDEANSDIYALEVQMQEGHDWIRENLGPQYVPKYGWSIDPFGYSPTLPYVLHNFGFQGILIQRVHYAVKKEFALKKKLEFYWRQTWDDKGTFDMFTHVMPFYSYDVPHTCGPDPSVCCQFDFARSPVGKYQSCPWNKPPERVTTANVALRAHLLLDQYLKKASLYRGNAVLVPLGDDFRYDNRQEAENQFTNYKAIMKYVNENIPGVTIKFGTLREYFEKIKGSFEPRY